MRFFSRLAGALVAFILAVYAVPQALAHSMYQSAVLLDMHSWGVEARLELPPSSLGKALGQDISEAGMAALRPRLEAYILERLLVQSDGRSWTIAFASPLRWERIDGAPYIVADLSLTPPSGADARSLTLTNHVIADTLLNHVVLVSVRSDWNSSTFANDPELLGVLTGEQRTIAIDRTTGHWTKGFSSVFHLGIRHIAEGTDHLLFLLALLLPAPLLWKSRHWGAHASVRHGFIQILKVVTAFTLGHSLTLALAAFGLVHVPARPIEALIAVSVLVSAIHAMRPLFPGKEAVIAGAFGLIHGLAFASTLAELGLHGWERLTSILAFNLGIEAMQLLVVVSIMPSLMMLSRTALYTPFRLAGASLTALVAVGWVVERTAGIALHIDHVVDSLARSSIRVAMLLFVVALAAFVYCRTQPSVKRVCHAEDTEA